MTTRQRRNSLRYPGYDYAQPGAVFVTLCTYNRQHLFGTIRDGRIAPTPAGDLAIERWQRLPERFPSIALDMFALMPDHFHAILFMGSDPDPAAMRRTTGDIVRAFKTAVIAGYRKGVERHGWPPYHEHLWQTRYHDRIVRSERELEVIRAYIEGNPSRWEDRYGSAGS